MKQSIIHSCVLVLAIVPWATGLIHAQSLFSPREPFGANINAVPVPFIADINSDGAKEVILGSTNWGEVIALKLTGDSIASLERIVSTDLTSQVMHVEDVNNDGIPDLIRGRTEDNSSNTSMCLAVYLGVGDGLFASPIITASGIHYFSAQSVDLTGDGRPEIIAHSASGFDIYDLDLDTEQLLLLRSIPLPNGSQGFLIVDVTGDGVVDLIIFPGDGTGPLVAWDATLGMSSPLLILDTNIGYIGKPLAADFNNDGRMDLFASKSSNSSFFVWTSTGGHSFTRSAVTPLGASFNHPYYIGPFVDLDQDGIVELLHVEHDALVRTEILPNLSIGAVDTLAIVPDGILSFKFDDLDIDGATDIVIISEDTRLLVAHGGGTPGVFNPPVPLFSWNNINNNVLTAVDPDMNGVDQLAMISFDLLANLVLFNEDPEAAPPRLTRTPMQEGQGAFLNVNFMEPYDLDNDGDADLIGYQAHDYSNNACDLFCMEDSSGVYVHRCVGTVIADSLGDYFYNYSSLTAFDVNGDGLADLLCKGIRTFGLPPEDPTAVNFVLIQTSPLQFELGTVPLPIEYYSNHHDLDGDGLDELLVQTAPDELSIYHNEGAGIFTPLEPIMTDGLVGTLWADANGDGVEDLISFNYLGGIQEVAYRTITMNNVSAKTIMFTYPTTGNYKSVKLTDLDQDGLPDMLFTPPTYPANTVLYAYMNSGSYPFTTPQVVDTNFRGSIFPIDIDGDGDLDIVSQSMASFFFYRNNGIALSTSEIPGIISALRIHPNPGSDNFTIDLPASIPEGTISIHDITGREVLRQRVSAGSAVVHTERLPTGLFTYRLVSTTGNDVRSGKWMKE